MSETTKLDGGGKHLLRLVSQGEDSDGWATVSKTVFPLIEKVPKALISIEKFEDGGGRARLTTEGKNVINAMSWLDA